MSGKTRSFLLSLTIIAVIVFSAFGTTRVYADGGTTPDPPPVDTGGTEEVGTEATEPATEAPAEATAAPEETTVEASATEAPVEATAEATEAPVEVTSTESTEVASEATATEEPVATEASATEEAAAAPEATEEAAPATEEAAPAVETTVLDAVPENTTVAVVDANGDTQPLATQAAAEAVATSDPIWCPAGASPTPGANGCTQSFTSFTALLTELSSNPTLYTGAGTIYVQQGAYQGGESSIDFNAYNLSNISSSDLTVTGGWNTTTGAIDPAAPSTFSNVPIIIGSSATPWGGSLTLSNLGLSFTTNFSNNAANQAMNGLSLYSTGSVTMVNVNVTNAPNNGAEVEAGGDVNIVDSKFDRNQNTGAKIKSGGSVTVVNGNFGSPSTARRQDVGLDIQNPGAVTLINVLANENRVAGTTINSGGPVSITASVFSGTKVIQGADFLGYGLQVVTPDAISLESVTASDNFLWGASLQAGGNIAISNSIFNANTTASPGFIDDTGLFILQANNVALSNVQASDNRLFGAQITASGTVSVVDSIFNNNRGVINTGGTTTYHGHGLQVNSVGGIFLGNVTADGNMLFGAQLTSGGEVDISFSSFSNTSTGSSSNALGKGLEVNSGGNVSLLNVVVNNNQTVGADLRATGDVTLNNVTATGNGSDGVLIQGICTSVNGGTFTGNGGYGLNLGTSSLDLVAAPAFSNNSAGDLFPAAPALCAVLLGAGPAAPAATGSSAVFTALQTAPQQNASIAVTGASAIGSSSLSLKNIVSKAANGGFGFSIFGGKYGYTYSNDGLQIVAWLSSSNETAVRGAFRAY